MRSKITFFLLIILFIWNLTGNKIFAQTISAASTPSTCTNNGSIILTGTDLPTPIVYGIAKSPYNEPDIISSSSPSFTGLQPGDYFYGYFSAGIFIKSASTVNVANNYNTTSPTFSNYYPIFYAYCGSTDPLGSIYATLTGGNKPYTVELRDSSDNLVQQQSTQSSASFTGLAAGNYTLRATDNCGTVVLAPNTVTLRANVLYTNFTLGTVSQQPSSSNFTVVFSTAGDVCTPITSASVTHLTSVLSLNITDVTSGSGTNVPQYYGPKNAVYKLEVQNAAGGFDVYDNLTVEQAYALVALLPNDRSKWGIIRGSVTICGITKTNQLDLSLYNEFKRNPFSFVGISIYDDPTPIACVPPTQVQFTTNLFQSGGCQPITLDVTEKNNPSNTKHYELPFNFSFKLDIGKTYVIVIKDATGQVLPTYTFKNLTTSPSTKPTQTDPNNLFIDPVYFTPLALKDKITLTDGPSSKNIGKSALVINNITTSLGLVAPVRVQTISGPTAIDKTFTPTSSTYYVGLGNNLIPGTYKIRVTDAQCFSADYDVELASYFVSVALQNVTYDPSPVTCDRYIKKGQIRVTAVGKRLTGNPDIITNVYGSDSALPRLLKMPAGSTIFTSNSSNFTLTGDATLSFTFTADISGSYELALSRQNDNRLLLPSEIFENTTSVPLEVVPNFPSFDLAQSGGVICPGNTTGSLTVKVNNTVGAVTYFIKKDTDADFPVTGQSSATFTALTAGNYVVKAKTNCFEVIQPFTLKPATDVGDIIVGDNAFCTGGTLNLSTIALGPVTSIVWTLPDNSTVSTPNLNISNLTTANNGEYKVHVVTAAGCNFDGSIIVTVNPNGEVALPVFNALSPPLLCQSNTAQQIDYTATATNASSITYTISPAQAGTIGVSGQPATVEWNPAFSGTATITATASGCGLPKSTNFIVVVNPRSTAADIISEGRTICPDQTGIILNALAPTLSNPIFTWYDSNLSSASVLGTGENLIVSPTATTTYYVGVEADDLCINDAGNRKEVTVTVNPLATVGDINVSDQIICGGETATLTATSVLANPSFKWYTDAALTNLISNTETLNVTPAVTTTYYVTVEADGICAIPPPAKEVTVTVNPLPTAQIAYSSNNFCNRGIAEVTRTGTPDGTYSSDAGLAINSASGEINLATSAAGNHIITYTFIEGTCTNTATASITIYATTLPTPLQAVTAECSVENITAPTLTDYCAGEITAVTNQSFPITTQGETDVNWLFDYGGGYTQIVVQKVIIKDVTRPIRPVLPPIIEECSATLIAPTTTDNCTGIITGTTPTLSPITAQGITSVIWTFNDGNGNSITATQIVIIDDTTAPVIALLDDVTGECSVTPPTPTTTDNCDPGTITGTTETIFPITKTGKTTVIWKFADSSGNYSTAPQDIYVTDSSAPIPPVLSDISGQCSVTPPTPTATDNCAGIVTGTTNTLFPVTAVGTTPVTWLFEDGNGNSVTAIQNIIISNVGLAGTVSTACASDGSGYVLTLNVSGEAPYTATGTGAPGTWSGTTWTSGAIPAGTNYNVSIQDVYACNTLVVSAAAPICCLFDVVCPTFPATTITCYNQLPTATTLTEAEFEALGNGDGTIGNIPCGVIEITASNGTNPGCNGNITRTYTVTEYADPNNNGVRDAGENTILNTSICTQTITIDRADFTMPPNDGKTVACPADVVAPTVPVVTDNCGNILTPSTPIVPPFPACNGDVPYTYTFTDCEGNTHNWVYTYTINRANFTMPANQGSTVSCSSFIVAPTVPVVIDNCGNTLTPSAPVISTTPACNGDVTYKYTFTDCTGNTHDWVYTYTIERLNFTMPANQGSTVACAASIVFPILPVITDNCGNILRPSIPAVSPTPCNGDVTFTYTYTDCAGNKHDWVYTYTIERLDFTMPANQGSTVACAAAIVAPTVPVVTDNCGNTLTPSAPIISTTPACNGDVTYTYIFTDCAGNTHNWVYTYTIERLDFTMPANQGSTVACAASMVFPILPVITDNCGNILTPSIPAVSPTPCNGDVTYTYSYTDCAGNKHDWVYTYTIERLDFTMPANQGSTVACAALIVAPTVPVVTDNCSNTLTPSAPVISTKPACNGDVTYKYTFTDCAGNTHDWIYTYTIERTDFTMPANGASTVACATSMAFPILPVVTDNCGNILTPSVPTVSPTPICNGDVTYTYTYTDCAGNTHDWIYTYTIERTDFTMPANGASTVACAAAIVVPTVPVVTDNCGNTLTPSAPVISTTPACNGDVTYKYTYTDCAGNAHDWIYTYTIERTDFTMPANQGSTVACATSMAFPILPVVTDNCGNILTPSVPTVSPTPICNGDVTYTYTYTDCAGNKHDWVYTYTIERLDFTMPANQGSTVACAAAIVAPTVPVVTDNCGNTLTPSAPVISTTPACNGDVTYKYTFTDCTGNTHDWVYTYTIERLDFTMPANQGSTVACVASIVTPIVPVVTDNCGNTLTPSAPLISTTPACNGDVTYTYNFTDCTGNTHDWVYTYTIERADFTMPANQGSTVACSSSIVAPILPVVTDNCGNILTPSAPVITVVPNCDGIVTYTYIFTDCAGNTHDWVYTYTIDRTDFVMPINGGSTVACATSIVNPAVPTVTDNCGNILTPTSPVITVIPNCDGIVTYTYTFTDCKGNTHDWIYTYTIDELDFIMPANEGSTVACAASVVAPTVPVVIDNCGNIITPSTPIISTIPACNGTETYTYSFTDCKGNTHDWVYTYTIDNTIAPTGTAPANLFLQCMDDVPIASIDDITNAASNCTGLTVITVADTNNGGTGCTLNPYIVTRTYTLTDCGGLATDLVQTITVIDTTAPVFTEALPTNITVDCSAIIPTAVTLTATDNCSTATVTYNEVKINGNCSGNYQLQRRWTASDTCGNETTHVQIVTVADTTAPVFTAPLPPAIVEANCNTIPPVETLTATDNCGTPVVNYTETKMEGSCSSKYELLRTWTATDECGNETAYTQTINVSCLPDIYNAISPNADGMNDTFKIEGIDCFPNNSVEIFNRYGVAVYKKDNYDNVTNPFEGVSDGRATFKRGEKLPTGTYFYILRYDDNGNRVEKSGYLYISNQ